MKTTTLEVTFRVTAQVSEALDENSVKAAINNAQESLRISSRYYFQSTDDTNPDPRHINVRLSKLKQNGKLVDLGAFGTPELPWK